MSCYFRHIKELLNQAGIEVTPANKKLLDRAIHEIVGVNYKDCPSTWKALRQQVLSSEQKRQELINRLRDAKI
jgi:hypothetical protein